MPLLNLKALARFLRENEGRLVAPTIQRLEREVNFAQYPGRTTRAALSFVTPKDYLRSTTPESAIEQLYSPLDWEALRKETQSPYIGIASDNPTRILAHEGRHRSAALDAAGIEQMPLVLDRPGRRFVGMFPLEQLQIRGQFPDTQPLTARFILPLHEEIMGEVGKVLDDYVSPVLRFCKGGLAQYTSRIK